MKCARSGFYSPPVFANSFLLEESDTPYILSMAAFVYNTESSNSNRGPMAHKA